MGLLLGLSSLVYSSSAYSQTSGIVSTSLPPLAVQPGLLVPGQTVLAVAVVPGLPTTTYNTPYLIQSTYSAANAFGASRLTRAIGELFRQQAQSVLAVALAQEADIPQFFDYMIDEPFDILAPVGLTATPARVKLFGQLAYTREQVGRPIVITMPADLTNGSSAIALTASPAATAAGLAVLPGYPSIQISRYFIITVDQLIINPNVPSQYVTDAAPSIAGLLSRLTSGASLTNQPLLGVKLFGSGYNISDAKMLSNSGYFVLRNNIRRGLVPVQGVTATSTNSTSPIYSASYHNISTLRAAQLVVIGLQSVGRKYVGEPGALAINGLVEKVLSSLKANGVILSYDYGISIQQVAGTVAITASILPPGETRYISVNARVNFIRS